MASKRSILCLILVLLTAAAAAQEFSTSHSYSKGGTANDENRIIVGAEQLGEYLLQAQHKTTAVVANQASLVGQRHLVDTLLSLGADIKYIMCPEHGFRGDAEAGAKVKDGTDPATGIPIISLYGNNKKPKPEQLPGVDIIIFDLQDVGCRFYTYISTLHYVMEYCAENHIETLFVLDRPNPNASYVDGPVLESQYTSFVGMHPGVPIVYGMTIGEYALMINEERWLKDRNQCSLYVVAMQNYTHDSIYHLPVAPSPNLQTPQAIALYPSLCLFEGTNISVGRGTDCPFEYVGSPTFKHIQYHGTTPTISFVPRAIKGVSENPPFKGQECHGLDLTGVEQPHQFDLSYLMTMYQLTPHDNFFLKSNFFEKLAGTAQLRKQLQQGATEKEIRESWQPGLDQFKQIRQKYLIYR